MQDLFRKYLDDECSPEEVKVLLDRFSEHRNEINLRRRISESLASLDVDDDGGLWNPTVAQLLKVILQKLRPISAYVISMVKSKWFNRAAIVMFLVDGNTLYNMISESI